MKKYSDYMILPEFGLILECCKGRTSVEDAVRMKKEELSDSQYNPDYNILVNLQDFDTSLDSTTNMTTESFFNFLKGLEIKSKIAILTAEPHQVVISMILRNLSRDLSDMKIEVFSTVEAAIRYLGYTGDNLDQIDRKIIELNADPEMA